MTRSIEQFIPPMEPFVIWEQAFTPEECDMIISAGELEEFNKARVGPGSTSQGFEDASIRDTDIVWIPPQTESVDNRWIFDRYAALAGRINFDKFQIQLDRFDGFQYSKYEVDGHYTWHNDVIIQPPNGLFRKLSFVTMLSEDTDYEGGDFLIVDGGNCDNPIRMRLKRGQMIVFYSWLPHKVEPVTKGTRITLVSWALGQKPL